MRLHRDPSLVLLASLLLLGACKSEYAVQQILNPDGTVRDLAEVTWSGHEVSEDGSSVTATFKLRSQPVDKVVFNLKAALENELIVDPPVLEFNPDNWTQPQTVQLIGQADEQEDLDRIVDVSIDAGASDDLEYKVLKTYKESISVINVPGAPKITRNEPSGWRWASAGGGTGTFIYSLDDTPIDEGSTTTELSLEPNLTPGLHVLNIVEVDSKGTRSKVAREIFISDAPVTPLPRSGDTAALAESKLLLKNPIVLSGEVPSNLAGSKPVITYEIIARPDGSTASLQSGSSAGSPVLLPDRPGTYVVQRTVTYDGMTSTTSISFIVEGFGTASLVRSSVTGDHNCALSTAGKVYCWGANDRLQLGIDFSHGGTDSHSHQNTLRPELVAGLTDVSDLSLGASHSCALLTNGNVKCWGDNRSLQLGSYSGTQTETPTTIASLSSVTAISAGKNHSCAILGNKTIKCWGEGSLGELGNGSSADSATPLAVSGISTAEELSCGNGFCCARLTNKSLKCWGRGDLGQLGNGATSNQNAPVSVSGISNAATVMAGESHACAITDDGAVYCWGQGTAKQLGNGASSNSSSPVRVTNY